MLRYVKITGQAIKSRKAIMEAFGRPKNSVLMSSCLIMILIHYLNICVVVNNIEWPLNGWMVPLVDATSGID